MFGNRLLPRADHVASSLSYANRRRVEIARALASQPKLLLLDEPTAGMNPAETLELAEQIKSLHQHGLTIVLIEHKLDVVVSLADKVVVLDHGEKIAEGTPDVVRRDEEVIRAYLGRSALQCRERRACCSRIQRGRHPLRRPACAESRSITGSTPARSSACSAAMRRANRRR